MLFVQQNTNIFQIDKKPLSAFKITNFSILTLYYPGLNAEIKGLEYSRSGLKWINWTFGKPLNVVSLEVFLMSLIYWLPIDFWAISPRSSLATHAF